MNDNNNEALRDTTATLHIAAADEIYVDPDAFSRYMSSLVNMVFKILPLRESDEKSLQTYMKALQAEIAGCSELANAVAHSSLLVSLVSILQYIISNPEADVATYKREVFGAIEICNKLEDIYSFGLYSSPDSKAR